MDGGFIINSWIYLLDRTKNKQLFLRRNIIRCTIEDCKDLKFLSLTSPALTLTAVTSQSELQPVNTDPHRHRLMHCRYQHWHWTDLTWWCRWCWGYSATAPRTDARRTRRCWRSRRAAGRFWWAWPSASRSRWTSDDHFLLSASQSHSGHWGK